MRSCRVVLLLLCVGLRAAAAGPKCGGAEPSRAALQALRVVGGSEAARGSHPWLVSLRNRALHFCGGAIVSERWILTAAHCFTSTRREFLDSVTVAAGEHDRRVPDEEEQIFHVKSVRVHERYRHAAPMSYDVALVELDGHVQFGVLVRPICLPLPDERSTPGSGCIVAGWGRTRERGRLPAVLREVPLDLLHRARCQHVLWTVGGSEVGGDTTVLCAGPERGGRDACQGDSGSPLICPTRTGQWEVVGVTSWGKGCGRSWSNNGRRPPSRRGSPGIFTDVRQLLPWIKLKLREAERQRRSSPVTGSEGLIRNPDPPAGRYGDNELCVWHIGVADGFSVLLEFQRFHLEGDPLCRRDRLSVLTGTRRPVGCGTVVLLKDQLTVESPNYPQSYREDCELRWVIHAPAGHIVKLGFEDFDLEESSRCSFDSLTVLADVEGAEPIAVLCGRGVPPDVLSHHGMMVLLFSSDGSVSHRGFRGLVSYISLSDLHDGSGVEGRAGRDRSTRGPGPPHGWFSSGTVEMRSDDWLRAAMRLRPARARGRLGEGAPLVDESGTSGRRGVDPVSDDEDDAGDSSGHDLDPSFVKQQDAPELLVFQ
ncbi:ovochymase-2 [Neosynchiropus ocellatus]